MTPMNENHTKTIFLANFIFDYASLLVVHKFQFREKVLPQSDLISSNGNFAVNE